jgi:cell division protein FtsQ
MTEAGIRERTGKASSKEASSGEASSGEASPAGERRRPSRWKAVAVALLVLGVLGAAAWVLLGSRLLVVRTVEVTGTKLAPRDRIVATAGIRLGLPMARVGTGSVESRLERMREVEAARVERRWPATVTIAIRERVPVVTVERNGRHYQLDRYGVAVADGQSRPQGLPTLSAAAPGPTDASTLAALRVLHALPGRLRGEVQGVEAPSPEAVTLRLAGGRSVVWGPAERSDEKIRLVDALRRTAAGRAARTIYVSAPEVVTTR